MEFPYRTALVTGASSGIGASLARRLAAYGVDLVLVARREDRLEELAGDLRKTHGIEVEVLASDLTDDEHLEIVERRLTDPGRPVELLVNNAGSGRAGRFTDLPIEVEVREVRLNLVAPLRLAHAVLPPMIARGAGGVLFVSSMVAQLPMPGNATYGATKAALTSLAESLHIEVKDAGVHVCALSAGLTHTEFHDVAGLSKDAMPKMVPWMTADDVAAIGLKAVAKGKAIVVPGGRNKTQIPMLKLAPRGMLRAGQKKSFDRG